MADKKIPLKQRVKNFFKRNSYAIVVASSALVLAIALAVTATMSAKLAKKESGEPVVNNNPPSQKVEAEVPKDEDSQPSNTTPIVFTYPVKDYTLGKTYSDTTLVYNETLKEYTTHLGVDFIVADGAEVNACYAGTIESISYDSLTGTTIVIDHGNGLKSSYMSLSQDVAVAEGQTVNTGEVIGKASNSASGEQSLGAHVHFETTQNGELINPMTFLGEK